MTKIPMNKLASALSGKERAKIMISSWHASIMGKEEMFSKGERNTLLHFDATQSREAQIYSYYMNLYKHGYFYFGNAMQQIYLQVVGLSIQLQQFHAAFGIDMAIEMALGAIGNVPTFLAESEFRQKREQELTNTTESVAYLANHETNAILKAQGFFNDKNEMDYYLDIFEPTTTIEELEKEMGSEWSKIYWEQISRIRALVKDGTLQPATIPDNQKTLRGIQITKVEDGVSTKSWENFEGKFDKEYRPYLEMDELYAVSFDPDEIKNQDGFAFKVKLRDQAVEICKRLKVLDHEFTGGVKKMKINEKSLLVSDPQKILRKLEEIIQALLTYKQSAELLEQELDGLPLFDEESYSVTRKQFEYLDELINSHNEFINKLEKSPHEFMKYELVDKESYLLKKIAVDLEKAEKLAQEIRDLAEKEVEVMY